MKIGRWRIVDKFIIPNLDQPDETYLTRWRIIETPWCGLFLHRFDGPDSRPVLHDHPWSFVSIILRGGYIERRRVTAERSVTIRRHVRFVNVMRRDDQHYVESLDRSPTWSLVLVGKRRRTWGYWRPNRAPGQPWTWTWTPFDVDVNGELYDLAMASRRVDL